MINAADADAVIVATPVDLARLITISRSALRVRYNLVETSGSPTLDEVLKPALTAAAPR